MANPFVHVELNTTDVAKAKEFYGSLFDWKLEDVPVGVIGTYTMIGVGGGTAGGIIQQPMPGQPSFWLSYVSVDDIHAATAKARSLGATIIRDVTPVAEMGWLSIIKDPTGAGLGLWQMKKA
ncbi:MAG TPA: VOC family protein [Bryobacteraceae bacterium]|jgi:predicted enzyme related to lactoylglutathione lyase|nr:VOC family protein [Bryobacteraceae bacterium]